MKLGSLFSGGGLGDLGFMAAGMDITWQCEIDEYCQKILELRYPESKKYRDIKTLKGADLEPVDIITGGFPCQPFSVAGKKRGNKDDRHLWPEMLRVIKEVRPRWVVGENVTGVIDMELENICLEMEASGYKVAPPVVFSAHSLGASHPRERMWIFASNTSGFNSGRVVHQENDIYFYKAWNATENFRQWSEWKRWLVSSLSDSYWKEDPSKHGGINDGRSYRVEQLKLLGNGQTPAATYVIGKMIMEIEANLINSPVSGY